FKRYNPLDHEGISFQSGWSMKRVKMATKANCGYWLDDVYDYKDISDQSIRKQKATQHYQVGIGALKISPSPDSFQTLDEDLWNEFTEIIETARKFIFDTCRECGVVETEAHFLTIKCVYNMLTKFRIKFFVTMGGKENSGDYHKTVLKQAVNILVERFARMAATKDYMFSKEAADGKLSYFLKQASWDIARELAEDTTIMFHAKITL
ncbi:hypothetical protein LCGC14_1880120, partial [marine sediment metagenome]